MKLNRVYRVEWITGLAGVVLLASLFFPWFGDDSALESMSVVRFFLILTALMAISVPPLVSLSGRPNVPIACETLTATLGSLTLLLVVIRFIWSPDGGLRSAAVAGILATGAVAVWGWKSVSRGG